MNVETEYLISNIIHELRHLRFRARAIFLRELLNETERDLVSQAIGTLWFPIVELMEAMGDRGAMTEYAKTSRELFEAEDE